jgi:hypothetical protein
VNLQVVQYSCRLLVVSRVEWLSGWSGELSSVVLSESEVATGPTTTQLYTETLVTF